MRKNCRRLPGSTALVTLNVPSSPNTFVAARTQFVSRLPNRLHSTEQIAVGSRPFKTNVAVVFRKRINQHPIRFNVTIPAPREVATQGMISVGLRQGFTVNQEVEHRSEPGQILAPPPGQFDILLELVGATERPHSPKSA